MNPHKYVNCFQPKKQPDSVISVNQKPPQNTKITEKDCTDLQSLVKKSVDDINILFSLKQIQSSFSNIDTLHRKNQSLSVEKTIQRKFNSKASLNENANTINPESDKQNYTLNINNFINISNKTKKQTQPKYNYDDDSSCDIILTTSMNNTARLATIDNSNSNRTSRKSFGEKGKETHKHMTKVCDGNDKKKTQTKETLRSYVNVKHKGTKRGMYKGDEGNNSINESGFIKMKNEVCDSDKNGCTVNNKVGNDDVSPAVNGNASYRSSKCSNNTRKGATNGNICSNSGNTSKLTFNKVASQYQQHKVNIQYKHNKSKQQYNPFTNNNNNNTIDCSISVNSKKSNEHLLSHTLNKTETNITKQINNAEQNQTISLSTPTPFPNDPTPPVIPQNVLSKNPFQKYISKNIIKVQKARSSSIVFDNSNNYSNNFPSTKSKSSNIPLTSPNTPSKHNPSPLRKPSSSFLFSTQNYHSIINKIYTKEFPYKTFTTNDILKLMLFLNEYLIYTNALKDLNNMKILSSYSQLLSKNISVECPRIEHIDLGKYDKFVLSAKVIQRKWRECFVKKYIGSKDEVNEMKKMIVGKYVMKMGFKLKKVTGLFNSVVEGFGEIENEVNTQELFRNVTKLIN